MCVLQFALRKMTAGRSVGRRVFACGKFLRFVTAEKSPKLALGVLWNSVRTLVFNQLQLKMLGFRPCHVVCVRGRFRHLITNRSTFEGVLMSEKPVRLGQREQQIVELLLQGCDNDEIARQLSMARRTVKAHFNRLFLRFGITSGIKRVKLATLLYRRQLCLEANVTESASPTNERAELLSLLPKDSKTRKLLTKSEPPSTSSRTISESSMTSSDSGTASSSLSGTKPVSTNKSPGLDQFDQLEAWELSILGLEQTPSSHHN